MERRYLHDGAPAVTVEARADGIGSTVVGYAAVYYDGTDGTEFRLWDDLIERVMPGAFDRALSEGDDVRALFNHDPNAVLGRTVAKTLALRSDDRGLRYEIASGETSIARDVTQHIRRGDVTGSSFAFRVTDQDFRRENDIDIREIRGVELFDVGPVTYPAYTATTTGLRRAPMTVDTATGRILAADQWPAEFREAGIALARWRAERTQGMIRLRLLRLRADEVRDDSKAQIQVDAARRRRSGQRRPGTQRAVQAASNLAGAPGGAQADEASREN